MTSPLAILCYHRVIDDDAVGTSWPYLERGTAVREETLYSQVSEIVGFADLLSEGEALDVLAGRRCLARPGVWLTFDDGYCDVLQIVHRVETATVFITTSGLERALPADAWYLVLCGATQMRGVIDLGLGEFDIDLTHRRGRARLVDGPERRQYLRAPPELQRTMLRSLAAQLGAEPAAVELYLNPAELAGLVRSGWSIGAHGVTHTPFDSIDRHAVMQEATEARHALLASGGAVRSFALPDGAPGPHVEVLRTLGYECVLGLGDALAEPGELVSPRLLVPDVPDWGSRVLRPLLSTPRRRTARGA